MTPDEFFLLVLDKYYDGKQKVEEQKEKKAEATEDLCWHRCYADYSLRDRSNLQT